MDIFAALNQDKKEKSLGVLRVAILAHRHSQFSEDKNVILLQNLSLGQVHLDSY